MMMIIHCQSVTSCQDRLHLSKLRVDDKQFADDKCDALQDTVNLVMSLLTTSTGRLETVQGRILRLPPLSITCPSTF